MFSPLPRDTGPVYQACYRLDADALRRALENLTAEGDISFRRLGTAGHVGFTHSILSSIAVITREMVSMLLKAGHDVNARTNTDGPTALHIAVGHGRVDCVAALLAAGASLTVKYRRSPGLTPLDCVTNKNDNKFRRIVPMLLRAGSDMPPLDRLPYGATSNLIRGGGFMTIYRDRPSNSPKILEEDFFEVRPQGSGDMVPTRRPTARASPRPSCPSSPRSPRSSAPRSPLRPSTRLVPTHTKSLS